MPDQAITRVGKQDQSTAGHDNRNAAEDTRLWKADNFRHGRIANH